MITNVGADSVWERHLAPGLDGGEAVEQAVEHGDLAVGGNPFRVEDPLGALPRMLSSAGAVALDSGRRLLLIWRLS
jgi:hypothetical protein